MRLSGFSSQNWLTPREKRDVIETLIGFEADLIRWDNKRQLPLKSGGKTDIYVNLRNGRNCPRALPYIASIYRNPLLRLGVKSFVEVPDSVSCFAGHLSEIADLPYVTIREQAKAGRVSDAKIIGKLHSGLYLTIVDDAITTGRSKVIPILTCLRAGARLAPLVVLTDRQEGWKEDFRRLRLDTDVWAGMTLHDIRKHLIRREYMERCDQYLEKENPIVVALDGKDWEETLSIVDPLRTTGCILKVNDLFFEKGMELIEDLQVYGRVLADLSGHNIPNTVENTCRRLAKYKPWGVTVHASGQRDMIQKAVKEFRGTPTKVFAVTVLTSLKDGCEEVYSKQPKEQVITLAKIAKEAGANGVVCSGEELLYLKEMFPELECLVPEIRSPKTKIANGDQAWVSTPRGARDKGADYIVMDRQILTNRDPVAEVKRVLAEELGIKVE